MLSETGERDVLLANRRQLDQAQAVVDRLPETEPELFITNDEGGMTQLPAELSLIVSQLLRTIAAGGALTVGRMPEELTTTMAAKQLGISRPTLMRMIENGELPAHKVGTHTRLRTSDVLETQRARRQRQRKAFDELRALEDEYDEVE